MQRSALLAAIDAYGARHADEAHTVARFHEFVAANVQCFERTLQGGHVTGSAWLVDPAGQEVLLTHHKKLGIWVQLGGHADGDPDTFAVAHREAMEESGLVGIALATGYRDASGGARIFDLDIHAIPARGSELAHLHYDVRYALCATNGTEFRVSSESRALAWVPVASLAAGTTPSVLTTEASIVRMALKWRAGARV